MAQRLIGILYKRGEGVPTDYREANRWFRLAADRGDAVSQNGLGDSYENGLGFPKNDSEAVKWYRRSAKQGYADAQYNLGFMLVAGKGVAKDYKEANNWLRQSADQGHAKARSDLGLSYEYGAGVIKSHIVAYALYNLAAPNDESGKASSRRESLGEMMNHKEIDAAQALTRQLDKPGNFLKVLDAYIANHQS